MMSETRLEGLKIEYITSYMVLKVASTDRLFSELAGKALVSAAEYIRVLEADHAADQQRITALEAALGPFARLWEVHFAYVQEHKDGEFWDTPLNFVGWLGLHETPDFVEPLIGAFKAAAAALAASGSDTGEATRDLDEGGA